MDIKENFYGKLQSIREDYDKKAADDAKELANLGSGKSSRKGDKKILRNFRSDSKKYAKKAVTGMDEEAEQLDEIVGSMLAGAALGLGAGTAVSNAMSGNPIGKKLKKIISKKKKLEEEQLDEKMNVKKVLKNVKRAFAGWSGAEDPAGRPNRPRDVIRRFDKDWSSKKDQENFAARTDVGKGSPAELQVKRAKRNIRLGKVK